ncbi:MAG TPA: transglutaminase-like domain-containing protein [Vicinamibacterales bacterium]
MIAWAATMAVLVKRSYVEASSTNLATDLARYGASAEWRGIYYRGEKIGFTVRQIEQKDDGFELQEDGRLQMSLLGAITPARIRTTARVDREFALKSFDFLLDPGTGPTEIRGTLTGLDLALTITTPAGQTSEVRRLDAPPMLSLNLGRRLASAGLTVGARYSWMMFDPATLRNAPVIVQVGKRELVRSSSENVGTISVPAFRVEMEFSGLHTTAWITDTGEVLNEQSPMGLVTRRETASTARRMYATVRTDLLAGSAIVPEMKQRIDEPRSVRRLRMRFTGADLSALDLQGVAQSAAGNVVETVDPRALRAGPAEAGVERYLAPEPYLESDDPAIVAEAERALQRITGTRERAERLVRHVNGLIEKKPTVSLPSAREVLRTKVGDCNEHTALYVALARASGIPSRIAAGLTFVHGAFYYHAWPEVYLDEGSGRGYWLPVDPTLNQFPADATHVRLARGGLDKQTVILPLLGRMRIEVLDLELAPNATPILIGRPPADMAPLAVPLPQRNPSGCWFSPPDPRPPRQRPGTPAPGRGAPRR